MSIDSTNAAAQIAAATKELAKLPILGPAMWLFARDPQRKFTFVADLDWRLMPPLVLEQCKLLSKGDLPWAFVTWASVSDAVDARLRSNAPIIAPHEWKSGEHLWLIDVVAPFGEAQVMAQQVVDQLNPKGTVRAWLHSAAGTPELKELSRRG
jgi:cytolysin-activating lysine-acyltransferase